MHVARPPRASGAPASSAADFATGTTSMASEARPDWYGLPTKSAWKAPPAPEHAVPRGWSLEGRAQTVLGAVDPAVLGKTMMQEHLLVDLSKVVAVGPGAGPDGEYFWRLPAGDLPAVGGGLRFYGLMNEEDSRMDDIEEAIAGAELYKQFDGGCLVSPTGPEIGRDPRGLCRISMATGVHIVMGAGHYVGAAQDSTSMAAQTVAEIADTFVREVVHGVVLAQGNKMHRDGGWGVPTGVKAGIIGELGCSFPLQPGERKTLQAAAIAQRATGAPIQVHPGRDASSPMQILRELQSAGADLSRVVMCHMDRTVFTQGGALEIARTGCFMEYDLFGNYVSGFCKFGIRFLSSAIERKHVVFFERPFCVCVLLPAVMATLD